MPIVPCQLRRNRGEGLVYINLTMSCRCVVRQCLAAMFAWLALTVPGLRAFGAESSYELLPDSSNFVTASLLVISPTNTIYSVFGHCMLRMECPVHSLDYVFTFESDTDTGTFMTGVAGKAIAKYIAVPTADYLQHLTQEGRGVTQYELNLTLHEKQELWRLLDEDMMAGGYQHFNLLFTNCLSNSILKMQQCLQGEHFEWGAPRYPQTLVNGELFRWSVRNFPWVEFLFVTVGGTVYDEYSQQEYRLVPECIIPMLREARFVDDQTGARRPVLTGRSEVLLENHVQLSPSRVTPLWVFAALLALAVLITIGERCWHWRLLALVFDGLLLTGQTLLGLLLLFVNVYSELFGSTWNWYLIVFNPLPLLLWIWLHKRQSYRRVLALYIIVLAAFLAATPFIGVLDLPHQFITATLLVRCLSRYQQK